MLNEPRLWHFKVLVRAHFLFSFFFQKHIFQFKIIIIIVVVVVVMHLFFKIMVSVNLLHPVSCMLLSLSVKYVIA